MLRKTTGRSHRRRGVLLMLAGLVLLLAAGEAGIRPVVRTVAASRANAAATRMIQQAVLSQLEDASVDWSRVVSIERDAAGGMQAVRTDAAAVDRFQAQTALAVQQALDGCERLPLSIPLGTLTGWQLLDGRGPGVPLTVSLAGELTTRLESTFDAAGINQTRHRIILITAADVRAAVPWHAVTTHVEVTHLLAETVLVGQVPQSYTQILSGSDGLADQYLIYGQSGSAGG